MRPTAHVLLTTFCTVLFSSLFFAIQPAQAAPGTYIPVTITQPDGTQVDLFASGDEYYNWLHDANGYTVMQDPDTGYFVYADLKDGKLEPTALMPDRDDPAAAGLVPQLNTSAASREMTRREFMALAPEGIEPAPNTGTINNLVIFIRFSDELGTIFSESPSFYAGMLNTNASSLKSYYREASYNALTIDSRLVPTPGATILSYQDIRPRSYYQPYNSVTNQGGYTGGDNGPDRHDREHTLLRTAIASINPADFPSGAIIDADADGRVDEVTFIISGAPTAWSSLLWPHRWSLYTSPYAYISGKRVYDYSFQIQSDTNVGVLVHETFHVLGAPDLYHYVDNGVDPAGPWDIMDYVYRSLPPQHMGCYMKWKYGGWIGSIPEITTPGTYSLHPMAPSGECYRIASPNSTSEFYILEYRSDAGAFESTLPASGLLVYRINSSVEGNSEGPPDEVYVYRPEGIDPTTNGNVNQAYYSAQAGRTAINDATSPSPFLSGGSPGGLDVNTIGAAGATISFHYGGTLFSDVPVPGKEWMEPWIVAFFHHGITSGCGSSPLIYCPENYVTRAEMAVFVLRAKHSAGYAPPAAGHYFSDVPVTGKEWMEPWIDQYYREGMTTGCGGGNYCPENNVTRAEMAVFVLRALHGGGYAPPSGSGVFADVPVLGKEWMEPWIIQFRNEGITTGCGGGNYCPENNVTRAEMAVFIGRAYHLYP